jgi:hypothetical protein
MPQRLDIDHCVAVTPVLHVVGVLHAMQHALLLGEPTRVAHLSIALGERGLCTARNNEPPTAEPYRTQHRAHSVAAHARSAQQSTVCDGDVCQTDIYIAHAHSRA